MGQWDGENRRQFPRIVYPCLVKISSGEKKSEVFLTHTENISVGGIGVIFKHEFKLFSEVDLEIDLIDDVDHIIAAGRVVWSVRRKEGEESKPLFYDTGVEFVALNEKDKVRLKASIDMFVKKGFKVLKPVY